MNILLLVAHGSRREESNLEVESLSKKMLKFNSNQFDEVMPAFLEFASPSITEAIQKCSKIGARRVTVLPYFLSAGVHINRDIPIFISKKANMGLIGRTYYINNHLIQLELRYKYLT